jgi:hypothetical protein
MRTQFKQSPVDLGYTTLDSKDTPNGRFYVTPVGTPYPSITTVLGSFGKESIQEWKQNVGEEEAQRVLHHACTRGTAMHEIAERYLNNEDQWFNKSDMPHTRGLFNSIKPIIDKNINEVILQECPLYSDTLQCAGRVDLVARYDGSLSIVDFKTSRRRKAAADITNYFQQATAYALMFEERTGIQIPQIVIIMAVDDDRIPIVFIEKTKNFIKPLFDTLQAYKKLNHI